MNTIVHVSAILHCSAHRAFTMFTDSALLSAWLTSFADIEPVVGGKYELFWEPSDPENNSTIGCKITAIVQDRLIAFEWKSPKQYKHFANSANPLTHVVVAFIPKDNSTWVELVHSGWRDSQEWEEARTWQTKAWTGAFEKLKTLASST